MTRGQRALDDLDQQIREHLDEEVQDNIARGMSPDDARRAAGVKFGSVAIVKEDARAVWIPVWFDQLVQDVQYGLRTLGRSPGFTVVALLTLALGIGANTAIFTLIKAVMLTPLPVEAPERLVQTTRIDPEGRPLDVSYPLFQYFRDKCEVHLRCDHPERESPRSPWMGPRNWLTPRSCPASTTRY